MDKKPNTQRIYQLEHFGSDGTLTLIQTSVLEGEFGPVTIRCMAELEGQNPLIVCKMLELSGVSAEELYNIRNMELAHFIINILPLFNPLTFNKDALSFQEKE